MICPSCGTELPAPTVANLVICPNTDCLRTIVIDDEQSRIATAGDTTVLSDVDLKKLREARKRLRNA